MLIKYRYKLRNKGDRDILNSNNLLDLFYFIFFTNFVNKLIQISFKCF